MRFGWLAAAAAMVCAGPAGAARYYQFEVSGYNTLLFTSESGIGFTRFLSETTITATFDTLTPEPVYIVGRESENFAILDLVGRIQSRPMRSGAYFDLNFLRASITSTRLAPLQASGTYGYTICPSSCADNGPGVLLSVKALTSDFAIAPVGVVTASRLTMLPEPASWAMMIGGFGMVGGALRRKRGITTRYTIA